jgi:hypothetical protein
MKTSTNIYLIYLTATFLCGCCLMQMALSRSVNNNSSSNEEHRQLTSPPASIGTTTEAAIEVNDDHNELEEKEDPSYYLVTKNYDQETVNDIRMNRDEEDENEAENDDTDVKNDDRNENYDDKEDEDDDEDAELASTPSNQLARKRLNSYFTKTDINEDDLID